jgi:hypothetical protein
MCCVASLVVRTYLLLDAQGLTKETATFMMGLGAISGYRPPEVVCESSQRCWYLAVCEECQYTMILRSVI